MNARELTNAVLVDRLTAKDRMAALRPTVPAWGMEDWSAVLYVVLTATVCLWAGWVVA